MDYFNAFWFGGLICALIQILLDKTKLMPGRVMVLLVCSGAVLSAVGIYKPLKKTVSWDFSQEALLPVRPEFPLP